MAQRNRPGRKQNRLLGLAIVLAVIFISLTVTAVWLGISRQPSVSTDPSTQPTVTTTPTTAPTTAPTTVPTDPPIVKESSFTFSAMGDMLMHMPVVNTGYYANTNSYNFDSIFTYLSDYISSADYAAGNLETTLAGTDNGYAYSGYPQFNCPDEIIDGMKTAGFDMVLTANNHSYDTRGIGLSRTLEVIRERELHYLGTKIAPEDPNFLVVERNGIRLGLACYTYEAHPTPEDNPTGKYPYEQKALNGISVSSKDAPYINSFDYHYLDEFYAEMQTNIEAMKAEGADAVVLLIHWGNEYQTKENSNQSTIAQALCDLGVDVIIGGHPHVVQPVELLTSTLDESQKTVCLYSMGNAVSNQRLGNISYVKTAHTEDGVLFSVTFTRYSDGTVILEDADCLPTWVNLRTNPDTGRREYNILPLDKQIEDWTQLGLTGSSLASAQASYDRTMAIVGDGMSAVDAYLDANQTAVEEALGVK